MLSCQALLVCCTGLPACLPASKAMRPVPVDPPPLLPCPTAAALDATSGQLTALGRAMAAYPISPRHARMLLEVALHEQQQGQRELAAGSADSGGSRLRRALLYAVGLAAVLSVDSPFVHIEAVSAGDGEPAGGKQDGGSGEAGGGEGADGTDGEGGNAAEREERRRQREEAKKKRQSAKAAHAQFRVADSDALRWAATLGQQDNSCTFLLPSCRHSSAHVVGSAVRALRQPCSSRKPPSFSNVPPPPPQCAARAMRL